MKNVIRLGISVLIVSSVFWLTGCEKKETELNNPNDVANMMNFHPNSVFSEKENFGEFQKLFMKEIDKKTIQNHFNMIKEKQSDRSSAETLVLVEYDNGNKLLVEIHYDKEKNQYFIFNIVEVPEDVATFLEESGIANYQPTK